MTDKVKIGLIQAAHDVPGDESIEVHKEKAIAKHIRLVREAKAKRAQIICLQEVFYGPYFCAEQNPRWYDAAEEIPDGPTTKLFQGLAKELGVVIVLPIYEREGIATYYNTAAVIDADGSFVAMGSRDKDEVIIGEMDRRLIREVRDVWQFYRDRRPETYHDMTALLL